MNERTHARTHARTNEQVNHQPQRPVISQVWEGRSLLPTENTAGHTRPWGHLRFALRSQTRPQAPGGGADSRPHSAVHPDTLEPR